MRDDARKSRRRFPPVQVGVPIGNVMPVCKVRDSIKKEKRIFLVRNLLCGHESEMNEIRINQREADEAGKCADCTRREFGRGQRIEPGVSMGGVTVIRQTATAHRSHLNRWWVRFDSCCGGEGELTGQAIRQRAAHDTKYCNQHKNKGKEGLTHAREGADCEKRVTFNSGKGIELAAARVLVKTMGREQQIELLAQLRARRVVA